MTAAGFTFLISDFKSILTSIRVSAVYVQLETTFPSTNNNYQQLEVKLWSRLPAT
jgi:hypothetical protein